MNSHIDVLIVGAGLSGIGAACHLKQKCPDKRFIILEARSSTGGTWDLFRYPGIRSDSDMFTLGYRFKPWTEARAIADGPSILSYVRETAREYGINDHIRFNRKVIAAEWLSDQARWIVRVENSETGEITHLSAGFVFMCSGYYDYDTAHTPAFQDKEVFEGPIIHPQFWSEDIDYTDKTVLVIGSGATAVTLVPAMAEQAAHVTMLQRSPTYVVSMPSIDRIANALRRWLPRKWAYTLSRWKNILYAVYVYRLSRRNPGRLKARILDLLRKDLGPDFDIGTHFTPRYNPWDQRICLVPDHDLFEAIKSGRVTVETEAIERFTQTGVRLRSGCEINADLIVTATGLKLKTLGGVDLSIDGQPVDVAQKLLYRGLMFSDVPNLAMVFGYINSSWTLKSDLAAEYVCRLLGHMDRTGAVQAAPRLNDREVKPEPMIDFSSGYIERARDIMPTRGSKYPWRLDQNYLKDIRLLRLDRIDDGVLEFKTRADLPVAAAPTLPAEAAE